jgi:hypothetical protein
MASLLGDGHANKEIRPESISYLLEVIGVYRRPSAAKSI